MVDDSITHHLIAKGKKLEDVLKQVLNEIVASLRNGGIDCYYLFNEKQGGRGNSGPDALLVIHQEDKNFYFYIEAKNNKDWEWSLEMVKKKILKKFRKVLFAPNNENSFTMGIIIGHTKMSEGSAQYLRSCNIHMMDSKELPLKKRDFFDQVYYEKLKGYLLFMISTVTDVMECQSSKYVIEIIDDRNLAIKKKNKEIENHQIEDLNGRGFQFRGPKLMDCFGVAKGSRDGIKIVTPWKVISNNTSISITRRKIGTGLYCIRVGKKKLRKHSSFR